MTTRRPPVSTENVISAAKNVNSAIHNAPTFVMNLPASDEKKGDDLVHPLTGPLPTWRMDEEPIYLEVVAALGIPGVSGPGGAVMVADNG
jgi:hypothetical protein